MVIRLLKWFDFNVDGHDRDGHNTCVDEAQPMLAMVVVEGVASVVVVDVVMVWQRTSSPMMDRARG